MVLVAFIVMDQRLTTLFLKFYGLSACVFFDVKFDNVGLNVARFVFLVNFLFAIFIQILYLFNFFKWKSDARVGEYRAISRWVRHY